MDNPITYSELSDMLFLHSPYEGFASDLNEEKIDGWHSDHPVFKELINEVMPNLYIEVGTWLGASAIHAAGIMESIGCDGTILCVDTWLGSREFWSNIEKDKRYQDLSVNNGYPAIYFQFLANVVHRGLENRILPFPQTSEITARILADNQVVADMVYIDGSHEPGDVYRDIDAYWQLLKPGGILFGDDYDDYWPGLVADVKDFSRDHDVPVEERDGFWIIRKPSGGNADTTARSGRETNRIVRLERERTDLKKQLEIMTARAGHFYEQWLEAKSLLEKKESSSNDKDSAITKLIEENNTLEKTNRYYYEQLEGIKKYNKQLEDRLEELQRTHSSVVATNEKLKAEIIRLRKS